MDFNKIINEQRKNLKNKEKRKETLDSLSSKLQNLADLGVKKANELVEVSKDFIDRRQSELESAIEVKFSKNIYSDCISFINSLIVSKNVKVKSPVIIVLTEDLENDENISVANIIRNVAPIPVNPNVYIDNDGYVSNVFNAIATHFSNQPQLATTVSKDTIIISLLETEVEEDITAKDKDTIDDLEDTLNLDKEDKDNLDIDK